jgi:hypothetical protein
MIVEHNPNCYESEYGVISVHMRKSDAWKAVIKHRTEIMYEYYGEWEDYPNWDKHRVMCYNML